VVGLGNVHGGHMRGGEDSSCVDLGAKCEEPSPSMTSTRA
jgi:hypothetical protein